MDNNGIDYSINKLTEQDIMLIGDILELALRKFTDKGAYAPTALTHAVETWCNIFNKEMSWKYDEI